MTYRQPVRHSNKVPNPARERCTDRYVSRGKDKNMTDSIKDAPKKGILLGFVPHSLAIPGRPELGVFPFNVMFARSKVDKNGKIISATALYEPMLSTYKIDKKQCSMEYFNIYGHGSWLLIIYDYINDKYSGEKYVGEKLVGLADGKEWNMFFVHFTALGLSDGERCKFDDLPS